MKRANSPAMANQARMLLDSVPVGSADQGRENVLIECTLARLNQLPADIDKK